MLTSNPDALPESLSAALSFQIRAAHLAIDRDLSRSLASIDLSPEAFYVLWVLDEFPGQILVGLSRRLGSKAPNIHRILRRLEAIDLVQRRATADGRSPAYFNTPRGSELRQRAARLFFDHCARIDSYVKQLAPSQAGPLLKRLGSLPEAS